MGVTSKALGGSPDEDGDAPAGIKSPDGVTGRRDLPLLASTAILGDQTGEPAAGPVAAHLLARGERLLRRVPHLP